MIEADDVLISTVRPNLNTVVRVPRDLDGEIASTGFCVLRPKPFALNSSYLFYFTQTNKFVEHLTRVATGASYPAVSDSDIFATRIPWLPLPEQKRIAALLEKADRLRRTRRYARQLSDTFLQSVFLEMFGDPLANPKHWGTDNLRSLCVKFSDGPFGSNLKSSHYTHEGIRVVWLQNIGVGDFIGDDKAFISRAHFADLAKHECVPGDVLIGTLGDPNLRRVPVAIFDPLALDKADCVQARVDEK